MTAMKPVVLPRLTVTGSAVTHLRAEIVTGRLPPGEALPEARIGELLGVSRAPVREALTLLEREGLVAFDRRGTARVCVLGLDDVKELGLMRFALEPVAARLACERWKHGGYGIEANVQKLNRAKTLGDVTRLDVEFHRLILLASGNRRLLLAWEELAGQFLLVMTRFHQTIEQRTRKVRESTHRCNVELVAGLASGDPARAETLAREHATNWLARLEELDAFKARGEDR